MFLLPKFIQNGDLGRLEATARRQYANTSTEKLYLIYVESGVAHIATNDDPQVNDYNWVHEFEIGPAIDVAMEFDAEWNENLNKNIKRRFDMTTLDNPWFFWVTPAGALMAHQGYPPVEEEFPDPISPIELVPDGVTRVAALRGWKSINIFDRDQGLIVAYIRNGVVCYRNYCQQSDGVTVLWENERTVSEFADPVTEIALFRTNDYRVGFIVRMGDSIHWALTRNNWAGLGVKDERVICSITDLEILFNSVIHVGIDNSETVVLGIEELESTFLWASDTYGIFAENISTVTTIIEPDVLGIGDGDTAIFTALRPLFNETIMIDDTPIDNTEYVIDNRTVIFNTAPTNGQVITALYSWFDYGRKIKVTFDHGIMNAGGHQSRFLLKDDYDREYTAVETIEGQAYPYHIGHFIGSREIIIEFADFNNAYALDDPVGELHISYEEDVDRIQGEAGQYDVKSFEISFVPINLDPSSMEPPTVEAIWNE